MGIFVFAQHPQHPFFFLLIRCLTWSLRNPPFYAQPKCFEGSWLFSWFQRWTSNADMINQYILSPWPCDWERDGHVTQSEPMRLNFGTWDRTIEEKGLSFHWDAKLVRYYLELPSLLWKGELVWEWSQHGKSGREVKADSACHLLDSRSLLCL